MGPLFRPSRKADEGLATLSEDGHSPISLRQMAYGERQPGSAGGNHSPFSPSAPPPASCLSPGLVAGG